MHVSVPAPYLNIRRNREIAKYLSLFIVYINECTGAQFREQ